MEEQEEKEGTEEGSSPGILPIPSLTPPTVQIGVPWCGSLYFAQSPASAAAVNPLGFVHSVSDLHQGGGNANDEKQPTAGAPVVLPTTVSEYVLPHTQLELGHSMAPAAYQYVDPYYGGVIAAYGPQVYPHILGIHPGRMALPSEVIKEEPVYVNAKQYKRIMMRRQSRAKAESENKLAKPRKPYLHESRHLHAMRRARGCGGRFLNKKGDSSNGNSDSSRSEGQSSQGPTTPDSKRVSDHGGFKTMANANINGGVLVDPTNNSSRSYSPNQHNIDQGYQLNLRIIDHEGD